MLSTNTEYIKGKRNASSFLVQMLRGLIIPCQHPNFQHFDQNALNYKYCKKVSSISFNEKDICPQNIMCYVERPEVLPWMAPGEFEYFFKEGDVVKGNADHRRPGTGCSPPSEWGH